ncbi:MAG TPA: helix-turn-helix domain-containing protein [Candidatus Stackebrandtia excrementipullorum]|nr:helix-turn-helix domain-containing protein [Candidatus Stackebrandtia excrementipullorum]
MADRDIGGFIRDMRRNAKVSLRQLADQAGVSNPYLSQIERGLRKPSAEVLQQIANALKVSTPLMYLRAGLLNQKDGPGTLAAIAADTGLTTRQKQTLTEIYEAFRRENLRNEGADLDDDAPEPVVFDADVAQVAEDLMEEDEGDDPVAQENSSQPDSAKTARADVDSDDDSDDTTTPRRSPPAGRAARAQARRRNAAS